MDEDLRGLDQFLTLLGGLLPKGGGLPFFHRPSGQQRPDGALLAVGCHNEIHLYKTADKSELFPPVKEEKKEEKK